MENFPSNSNNNAPRKRISSKETPPERKKLERVVTGNVTRRKKPLGKRISENIVGGETRGVWDYVLLDVLIPAARDMIVDAGEAGLRRAFYPDAGAGRRGHSRNRGGPHGAGYTNYSRYSESRRRDEPRSMSRQGRSRHNFDEIIFENRVEAEEILNRLFDRIEEYGDATVSDLYDAVGITDDYTDKRYGWTGLATASVSRTKGGYILDLPRPEVLD